MTMRNSSLGGPLTRACVRLLSPCFKTGRVGCPHRRRPLAPVCGATQSVRTEDSPTRLTVASEAGDPVPSSGPCHHPPYPREGEDGAGRGSPGRRGSGRLPRPLGYRHGRGGGAVTLDGGGNKPPSPQTLPSRPRAGRGAPSRRKCTWWGTGPAGGRSREEIRTALARLTWPAELNPPGGLRGPHPFTSQRFHALLNSLFKFLFRPEPPSRRSETEARPRHRQRGWRNHQQPRSSSG
ncbi:hypothetical protein SKAU_G00071190 [Synaphobranchus kaupii]|uniref:Uncharacterized protein n=1 Tax=Synaphobranchus kaupii TaxID=118154 RepID=A0A9Q1G7X9_SYNKA|nr:hypothetical protein SKAU_G00071190 [Synaphobranchus kaupii]